MIHLRAQNICKSFGSENILNGVNFTVSANETVAIVGRSGSGKSTLLQICGLLDDCDSGEIEICGENCCFMCNDRKTLVRRHNIGFIYQFHHLLSEFTAVENLMLPQLICGIAKSVAKENAMSYLERFGLKNKAHSFVSQLSGGERQRIAILRSVINSPKLILADEPTGNLDGKNAMLAFDLLCEVAMENNACMVIVTHSTDLAKMCSRVLSLENGILK